jgi:hypothetical protein
MRHTKMNKISMELQILLGGQHFSKKSDQFICYWQKLKDRALLDFNKSLVRMIDVGTLS